ncbi:MAG: hypothetical protein GX998_05900 [Firmicutes bacterium]|nr:hypothetical protein [Bacillota bacterium]
MTEQFLTFYGVLMNHISNLATIYLPRMVHALLIIFIGWLVAALGRKLLQLGLRALGVDVFLGRLGIDRLIAQGKISRKPSQLVGTLFYGLAWFVAILMALDVLGLETASLLLENLAGYLPRLITSLIMLGLGLYAVDFVIDLLRDLYIPSRPSLTPAIMTVTRWGLTLLVLLAVAEHLGIARSLITMILTVTLGGLALTLVLAFGIGGIDMTRNILAGYALRMHIKVGDTIIWEEEKMQLQRIALTASELKKGGETLMVPNVMLASKVVSIKA